jgi:DNA-binding transcriptional regulator YiaG
MATPKPPRPAELLAFREKYGLSQTKAGELAYSSLRSWQMWESGETRMHPAIWRWVLHSVETKKP